MGCAVAEALAGAIVEQADVLRNGGVLDSEAWTPRSPRRSSEVTPKDQQRVPVASAPATRPTVAGDENGDDDRPSDEEQAVGGAVPVEARGRLGGVRNVGVEHEVDR